MGLKAYADHWAVVTGGSSGIGAEFARQLAARGMHLILVARREDRLRQLAEELKVQHGTQCEIIPCDLSQPAASKWLIEEIERRGKQIELFINNAGFGDIGEIETTEVSRVLDVLQVNIVALTELTYRVLPPMLGRGHGAVINVASVAAFQPIGYMSVYAASKAYVLHFSEALWAEARNKGVTVLTLCPGTTKTEFFDVAGRPGFDNASGVSDVRSVVRTGLKALDRKQAVTVAGWLNYIRTLLVRLASRRTAVLVSSKVFRPK